MRPNACTCDGWQTCEENFSLRATNFQKHSIYFYRIRIPVYVLSVLWVQELHIFSHNFMLHGVTVILRYVLTVLKIGQQLRNYTNKKYFQWKTQLIPTTFFPPNSYCFWLEEKTDGSRHSCNITRTLPSFSSVFCVFFFFLSIFLSSELPSSLFSYLFSYFIHCLHSSSSFYFYVCLPL
jgi:hypothetical protein